MVHSAKDTKTNQTKQHDNLEIKTNQQQSIVIQNTTNTTGAYSEEVRWLQLTPLFSKVPFLLKLKSFINQGHT